MPENESSTKTCTKCGEAKPAERFYRFFVCKDCLNARERFRRNNPGSPTVFEEKRKRTEKPCSYCRQVKPSAEFTGRSSVCRQCSSEYHKKWRESHLEEVLARGREYSRQNRVSISLKNKEKYLANRERKKTQASEWYARNREHAREKAREYYRDHAAEFVARAGKRRAILDSVTVGDRKEIEAYCEYIRKAPRLKCYWCKNIVKRGNRHVDHIVPLNKGGSHSAINLCCSCRSCNLSKHTKMPEEFSGQQEMFA